jgi:hypothetical protein
MSRAFVPYGGRARSGLSTTQLNRGEAALNLRGHTPVGLRCFVSLHSGFPSVQLRCTPPRPERPMEKKSSLSPKVRSRDCEVLPVREVRFSAQGPNVLGVDLSPQFIQNFLGSTLRFPAPYFKSTVCSYLPSS